MDRANRNLVWKCAFAACALAVAGSAGAVGGPMILSYASSSMATLKVRQEDNDWAARFRSATETDEEGSLYATVTSDAGNTKTIYATNASNGTVTGCPSAMYAKTESAAPVAGNAGIFGLLGHITFAQPVGSMASAGVFGWASAHDGVSFGAWGETNSANGYAAGVEGMSTASSGPGYGTIGYAKSSSGRGVYGIADAPSGTTYGLYGRVDSPDGYAMYASGDTGASGSKAAVVQTRQGPTELYAVESTEVWFEEMGSVHVVDGYASVALDPIYLDTITDEPGVEPLVFLQLHGPGRAWPEVRDGGFDVVVEGAGTGTVRVDFRVVGRRRGYESRRLRQVEVQDPHLGTDPTPSLAALGALSHEDLVIEDPR